MRFAMLIILGFFLAPSLLAEEKPDPRESLDTAIPEAIRLLEKKDYKQLLTDFMSPQDKKMFGEDLEELLPPFAKDAPKHLHFLKAAKSVKPKMDKEDTVARFELRNIEGGGAGTMVFVKSDKLWYWNIGESTFISPNKSK